MPSTTEVERLRIANCELRIGSIRNPKSEIQNSVYPQWRRRGQSALDYAVFIAVVAAALVAMQVYVRRSIQANLKVMEDQINAEAL